MCKHWCLYSPWNGLKCHFERKSALLNPACNVKESILRKGLFFYHVYLKNSVKSEYLVLLNLHKIQ